MLLIMIHNSRTPYLVILIMPFFNMLHPIEKLDKIGIQSTVQGHTVKFGFIEELQTRFIDQIQERVKIIRFFLIFYSLRKT